MLRHTGATIKKFIMKKNSTNYAIKMLGLTVIAFIAMLKPAFCQEPAIDNDLITYSMAISSNQQVKFRFPLDIRSGDMITGSVVEEKKNNAGEVNNASSTLQGVVIEIDGKKTKISNRVISFIVPAGLASIPFLLKNSAGEVIEKGQIPVVNNPFGDDFPIKFSPEKIVQPGQSFKVTGAFDGNTSNTNISLNGQACEIIAESPRMSYVQVPETATAGVSNLTINEHGIITEHKVNVTVLNLTAKKTNLLKGEKTTINVTVSGLENLTTEKLEYKLKLENLSPQTISFLKETGNIISKEINTAAVKNGRYEFSTKIIALTTGTFAVSAALTAAADGNECAKAYKDCVDAVDAKAKAETDAANNASNGTGAGDTIAKITKWANEAKAKCLAEFLECTKNK